ncbi:MAG TPA: FadR/GntR family transcriptional regulator [Bryobacteraceae bacterium]|nr:FadR/GntR family transcriptional regulator [Bryobacteraceae bacterium]
MLIEMFTRSKKVIVPIETSVRLTPNTAVTAGSSWIHQIKSHIRSTIRTDSIRTKGARLFHARYNTRRMPNPDPSTGNLSDRVAEHLISYIRANKLRSGDQVPSEVSVSSELGISRGIVREAYRGLRMAGILDISNGRPPRVGRINEGVLAHLLEHALSTEQATAEQALHLRAVIEVRAAELAAENRLPSHVDALQEAVAGMRMNVANQELFAEADARFHEVIGRGTGNPLFELISSALRGALKSSIRAGLRNRVVQSELDQVVITHQRIADAISDGDAVEAREYMVIHFREALRSFKRVAKGTQPVIVSRGRNLA